MLISIYSPYGLVEHSCQLQLMDIGPLHWMPCKDVKMAGGRSGSNTVIVSILHTGTSILQLNDSKYLLSI